MIVQPIRTRVFKEGESLERFIRAHIPKLKENSVLVVTSKIAALAESRVVHEPNEREKIRMIKRESDRAIKTRWVWLTLKDGMVMANAGIDESNAGDNLILLPKDSFKAAENLRTTLRKAYKVKNLAVLLTDSRTYPLRAGVSGIALGYAGMKGIHDYRGTKDILGRVFKYSQSNIADMLASAAVLVMGEGKEQQPLAVIEGAPVEFSEKVNRSELLIPLEDDMYLPFLGNLLKGKKRR